MMGYGYKLNDKTMKQLPSDLIEEEDGTKHFDIQFDIDEDGQLHVK